MYKVKYGLVPDVSNLFVRKDPCIHSEIMTLSYHVFNFNFNFNFNFIEIIYNKRYIGTGLQLARLFEAGQAT